MLGLGGADEIGKKKMRGAKREWDTFDAENWERKEGGDNQRFANDTRTREWRRENEWM